jgi:hypothetical protein
MDTFLMLDYIDKVLLPHTAGARSLLLIDSFSAHLSPSVMAKLEENNITVLVIPPGFTSALQPLDVCINKPVKERFRKKWSQWIANSEPVFTRAGNRQRMPYGLVLNYLSEAVNAQSPATIAHSFDCCGLITSASESYIGNLNSRLYAMILNKDKHVSGASSEAHLQLFRLFINTQVQSSAIREFVVKLFGESAPITPMSFTRPPPRNNRRLGNANARARRELLVVTPQSTQSSAQSSTLSLGQSSTQSLGQSSIQSLARPSITGSSVQPFSQPSTQSRFSISSILGNDFGSYAVVYGASNVPSEASNSSERSVSSFISL